MAHLNGTSALSRARSNRASATTSKPAQTTSRANAPGVTSTTTASHLTVSPTAPSHLSLFLANLRLLNFDLHPQWPDISTLTFSTKDAAGGQKKRVQSVEWALYYLFRLWDPEETRNKLQPFFPPLDQVQSLNLRAALLRGLEQAKKNGVLGRDAVVRKTMLDECKGERLEEVLAVFSSAVLKKVVAEQQLNGGGYPALAQMLALENRGYSGERTELTALVLAHRVSLRRTLNEKNASRARFKEFSGLLANKEKAIIKKREAAEAAKRSKQGKVVTDDQKREVRRTVQNNWTGDERWMEALLRGDSKVNKDGLLAAPYDRVWRRVQSGRLAELEETSAGLLGQLESRVRDQQERLQKWQGFRQRMFGKSGSEPAKQEQEQNPKRRGIDFGFKAHESLHFDRMSPKKLPRAMPNQLDSHYEALITGLRSDLSKISPTVPTIPSFLDRPQLDRPRVRMEDIESESDVISDISDHEQAQLAARPSPSRREPIKVSEEPAFEPVLRKAQTFDDEHAFLYEEPLTPSRLQRSSTIQSNSPSRTRLSMARRTSQANLRAAAEEDGSSEEEDVDEEEEKADELPAPPTPSRAPITIPIVTEPPQTDEDDAAAGEQEEEGYAYEDLTARTRRSMVGYEAARQKAQLERRRSLRKANAPSTPVAGGKGGYFPSVDEEEGDTTLLLAEELISGGRDDDYEAVFMSRPKLKTKAGLAHVALDAVLGHGPLQHPEAARQVHVALDVHRAARRGPQPQLRLRHVVVLRQERVLVPRAHRPQRRARPREVVQPAATAAVAAVAGAVAGRCPPRERRHVARAERRWRRWPRGHGGAAALRERVLSSLWSAAGLSIVSGRVACPGNGTAPWLSGLPASFQAPPNLPNINFNAPVIRLGASMPPAKPGSSLASDRKDSYTPTSGRPGLGAERGMDQSRAQMRESMQSLVPPTTEERLRTIFVHKISDGVGGEAGIQRLLNTVGRLRRWDSGQSHLSEHKGALFGFAHKADDSAVDARLGEARLALRQLVRDLFYPRTAGGRDGDGDTAMANGSNGLGDVEVINIPLAPEDELADIPAEMRATVAAEIAAFRDRSNQRDLERLRKEEEFEEMERQRNGAPRKSRLEQSPPPNNSNMVPLGPRGVPNAPSGPRGQNRGVDFVNGGTTNGQFRDEDDTDADDDELHGRELAKQRTEDDKVYLEAERKWVNRERQRAAALDREQEREKSETEGFGRRRDEQLERDKNWDDDREASRKGHLYYRDHGQWIRERTAFRAAEAARDEMDRRAEEDERRRAEVEMEHAKDMADSFLERQAEEMERQPVAPAAPQRVTISFGAAAQKAAQRTAGARRTVAEVEGLLDDEEQDQTTKRQLVPIKFEPITDTKTMSEEDIQNAVRALAHEIPVDRDGLWAWDVKWDYLEESAIREKLRPFVEKKVVEYLGVQEQFLVDVVEEHLRKHQKPAELVETLSEALDEDAEDMVKKLWRMVIFFTESEKRGLPA
ncbi:HAUS augmin-like complex subunit 6 N-terminus-domain-containing protein [Chaetomium fimeti]|uniref:HAUS augmin-like complex subunit 6 N-terminus-domain-containing protein n=1 Tax=Chaetomium fimeti TaxID=1854472 RepID=A0AAE0HDA7_9PEZI|nr:HAUS augmin-like complex subunit 6 N-terminus-domain-containing protein [Chaetomium fimeti]